MEAQGLEEPVLGLLGKVTLQAQQPHELQGLGILPVALEGLAEGALGVVGALLEDADVAQVAPGRGVRGILVPDGLQLPVQVLEFLGSGVVALGDDALEPDLAVRPVFRQQAFEELRGFPVQAAAVARFRQGEAGLGRRRRPPVSGR